MVKRLTSILFLLMHTCIYSNIYAQGRERKLQTFSIFYNNDSDQSLDSIAKNREIKQEIANYIELINKREDLKLIKVRISSHTSLPATYEYNAALAMHRSLEMYKYILKYEKQLAPIIIEEDIYDWQTLIGLLEASDMKRKRMFINIINTPKKFIYHKGKKADFRKQRLMATATDKEYNYIVKHYSRFMRRTNIHLEYDSLVDGKFEKRMYNTIPLREKETRTPPTQNYITQKHIEKKHYWAVTTNLLYDVAILPNIGIELYLKNHWTIAGNWTYQWLKNDNSHHYWRAYGGDIEVRRYLKNDKTKPLQGQHIGIYGGILTYDFEFSGEGQIADKWSIYGGESYGYSKPISKHLNIDFSLGVGYLGGEYKIYDPLDGHYVWQATKQRKWFGLTKAEVKLVWLLGKGNINNK